ncbi:MAG: LamG-like jellyroll fold domain-containing protein [Bacteroidota bacterium]
MKANLLTLFLLCCLQWCFAQDSLFVQTFKWEDDFRSELFDFPDNPGETYEKILMVYNMRCHDNAVGNGNVGCREWDYSCNTFLTDSTRVDSVQLNHPNYVISNFDGGNFEYSNQPTYTYFQFEQVRTTYSSTQSEMLATVGSGTEKIKLFKDANTGKSQYLYTAAELMAAGLSAGNITGLRLNLSEAAGTVRFLRLRLKSTSLEQLDAKKPELDGFTQVYFRNTAFDQTGLVSFNFYEDFEWNGIDNLLLELSYSSSADADDNVFSAHDAGADVALQSTSDGYLAFSGSHTVEVPAAAFDGLSDEITLSFWNRGDREVLPANSTLLEGVNESGQRTLNIHLPWGNSNIYWDCGNDGGSYDRINKEAAESDFEGEWNHWAFTKNANSGEMKIYLNGQLWHSGTAKNRSIDVRQFRLGSSVNGNNSHYGGLDEFRVFAKELDEATIQDWMHRALDNSHPAYSDLAAYYRFNKGSGSLVDDHSGNNQNGQLNYEAGWRTNRGADLLKEFVASTMRPNATFVQGVYQKAEEIEIVLDSIPNDPHRVIQYTVNGTDLVTVDTNFYWQAGFLPVYDENGEIVDDVLIEGEDALDIDQLTYFRKTPAKYELLSLVTPYGNGLSLGPEGKTFLFDVTDYAPILKGRKRLSIEMGGQFQEELDIKFVFIKGTPPRNVLNIQNIWPFRRGWYADIQQDRVFEPRNVQLMSEGEQFKLRSTITGHGQNGEFIPRDHYLNLNGGSQDFVYSVWKECSLNPVYPQGGTWTFDRAGWCPGMATDLHEFDITDQVTAGGNVTVDYGVNGASLTEANYLVSNQLVTYGGINRQVDASLEAILRPSNRVEYERINPACDNPIVLIRNLGAKPLTSLKITYGLVGGLQKDFEWTGNLAFGASETVALPLLDQQMWESPEEQLRFEVKLEQTNGDVDENNHNDQLQSEFRKADVFDYDRIQLHLRTNRRPNENSYTVKDHTGQVVLSRSNMSASTNYVDELDFPAGCYSLEFSDSGDDGLYYWYWDAIGQSRGRGTLAIKEWRSENIQRTRKNFEAEFGRSIQYDFVIPGTVSNKDLDRPRLISVYPNPAHQEIVVELAGFEGNHFEIGLLDVMGRELQRIDIGQFPEQGVQQLLQIGDLPEGVYFVRIANEERVWTREFVKQK